MSSPDQTVTPAPQTVPQELPASNPAPTVTTAPISVTSTPGKGNRLLLMILGALIILALVAAIGVYYYVNTVKNQGASNQQPAPQTAQVTPSPSPKEDLSAELNALDLSFGDSDFTQVDKEIQSL